MSKIRSYIKSIVALSLFSGMMLIIGCGVYTDVNVSADNSANLSNFKTYAWLPDQRDTTNSPYNNDILRSNLKNYFGQNFAARGFIMNLDKPDMLLQVVLTNKQRQRERVYPSHPQEYYFVPYYYRSRYYFPYEYDYYYEADTVYCYSTGICVQKIDYVEGSITLNVIDRNSKKLVWSGTAKGDIYDPANINKDIHPAVKRIMKEFPVKEVKSKTKTSGNEVVKNKQ